MDNSLQVAISLLIGGGLLTGIFAIMDQCAKDDAKSFSELKSVAIDNKPSKHYTRIAKNVTEFKSENFNLTPLTDPQFNNDNWIKIRRNNTGNSNISKHLVLKLKTDKNIEPMDNEYIMKDNDIHIYSVNKISKKKISKPYYKLQLVWIQIRKDLDPNDYGNWNAQTCLKRSNFQQFLLVTVFRPDANWQSVKTLQEN